jgi:hypothetical protein
MDFFAEVLDLLGNNKLGYVERFQRRGMTFSSHNNQTKARYRFSSRSNNLLLPYFKKATKHYRLRQTNVAVVDLEDQDLRASRELMDIQVYRDCQ